MRILSVGEVLWDIFAEVEHLGGAPLNFSAAARRLGDTVMLFTAVGEDQRGELTLAKIAELGILTETVQRIPNQATGTAQVRLDACGNATYSIPRPTAFDFLTVNEDSLGRIAGFQPDWLYFGTLAQTSTGNETALTQLIDRLPLSSRFYDMNLREGNWNFALVERLSRFASAIKLNEAEAETLFHLTRGHEQFSLEGFCGHWSASYGVPIICVTLGGRGCAIFQDNILHTFPGLPTNVIDTVGAGDAFAAAFLHGLSQGWKIELTASFANALGAIVAGRAGAIPDWTEEEIKELASGIPSPKNCL